MEYTLSLAIVDFLPVLFTALGLTLVARMVAHISRPHGLAAYAGAALTVAGGLLKAIWKLLMALSGGATNIAWMEAGLFIWMAPGYILLLWSVWQAVRRANDRSTQNAWGVPLAFNAVMFGASFYLYNSNPASPAWERVLLSVMVLATIVTGILLIAFGFRQQLPLAGWLFIVNLVGVFLLNGMARLPEQPISLQWIEEAINAVSWLCFAVAAWMVFNHAQRKFGVR